MAIVVIMQINYSLKLLFFYHCDRPFFFFLNRNVTKKLKINYNT